MAENDLQITDDLVSQWQAGDDAAFAELYELFVDKIYRYLYFKLGGCQVEDIVEQTFIKAWEKRATFDRNKSSFSTWLFTIARHLLIDFYRQRKDQIGLDELVDTIPDHSNDNPRSLMEMELNAANLRLALQYVEEPYREVVILRYLEDFTYMEIASLMGRTEGAVRVMSFRGLKKLRQIMDDLELTL